VKREAIKKYHSMDKILIIYGSLNSVPSPEGAAPAKVIEETVKALNDSRFEVLSNTNPKLKKQYYDRKIFHHVKYSRLSRLLLFSLKLRYSYAKRKQLFITASDQQLHFFILVCLFVKKHKHKKLIVHVSPGLVNMLKLFCPDVEIVFYHHGTSLHTKLKEQQWKTLLNNTISIFGVNEIAKEKSNTTFKLKVNYPNYIGIKNAISEPDLSKYEKDKLNNFTFLFSGRICPEKGVLNLLQSFEIAYQKNNAIQLIIAGGAGGGDKVNLNTPYIQKCKNFAQEKNLPIEFTGFLNKDELYHLLNNVNVVVLSTDKKLYNEGMPLCLIEAMAFSNPIIATDSGGNKELVDHGVNGFLISDYPYIESMAQAMIKLVEDQDLYRKMEIASRERFEKNHTYFTYVKNFKYALEAVNFI
jgi:glycosyltransferase involved in cell wall biosynthesis